MARRGGNKSGGAKAPTAVMVTAAGTQPDTPANSPQNSDGIMSDDFRKVWEMYTQMKANGERYKPLWDRISQLVGISVEPDYQWTNYLTKSRQLDEFVDDPTSAISVNQAGDYLVGIMWETGENVFKLKPSRYVTGIVDASVVQDWFEYATDQVLYHMNHPDCGYMQALQPYAYDQFSFGTSGIGLFKNQAFLKGIDENCLVARNFGIDNTRIKEGKGGAPDFGYAMYHWSCARFIEEFASPNGALDQEAFANLPIEIQNAWNQRNLMTEFDVVFLWMPREDFDPKLRGMRGHKWRGVWFMATGSSNKIFCEESFKERPVNMTRMIKVRGEDYGRSSGTILLSTIGYVNYAFAITGEILEKMANPAIGAYGNALFGDSILDTSPDGLTIFNQSFASNPQEPVFPIHDVGDPEPIIKFLLPYLNDKITTAFKVDALLDFNTEKDMTATESLQRYNIRGKSLSGILVRQKNERLIPDARRGISICWECGELGINAQKLPQHATKMKSIGQSKRIIPDAVLACVAAGKPWYEIEWNNELEQLIRTQKVQDLVQFIQSVTAVAALKPGIVEAVDWYDILDQFRCGLDLDNHSMAMTAKEFKQFVAAQAKQQAQLAQAAHAQAIAGAAKDGGSAAQQFAQAGAIRNGQAQGAGVTTNL